jgi:hypothetical protein
MNGQYQSGNADGDSTLAVSASAGQLSLAITPLHAQEWGSEPGSATWSDFFVAAETALKLPLMSHV